jgi:hypothetical protein
MKHERATAASDDDDPILEWALGERLGGERPPDLREAVRRRLARGAGGSTAPAARWFAAALVLLGLATVLGVAFWPDHGGESAPVAPPTVQELPAVQVTSLEAARALPLGTRAVEALGVGDAVIEALTRLRDLEVLIVREPCNESYGLSLKLAPPADPQHVTNASWRHFAKFTKLRKLVLSGTVLVARTGAGDGAAVVAALEPLPRLESLTMRCLDTSDEVVQRLPALRSLRELDLSFNHGFGQEGLQAVSRCTSLRRLSLRGCQQLWGQWMASCFGKLPELEDLDLGDIDGINWRSAMAEPDDAESRATRERWQTPFDRQNAGVHDLTLLEIADVKTLRRLDISGGRWTGRGLAALGSCTRLRELDISGGAESDPAFVASLPLGLQRLEVCADFTDALCSGICTYLHELRHLCLAGCDRITDRGVKHLCALSSLRELDLRQMRGLSESCVETLAAAKHLEALDLRHNDWLTIQHVRTLQRALPKLRSLLTNFTDEELAAAETLPDAVPVRSRAELDALPATVRNVVAADIDDMAMGGFRRLRALERLEIVAEWASPAMRRRIPPVRSITDAGLRELAGLPALRILKLGGELEVHGPGFDVLAKLPAIEELDVELMKVDDAAFAQLAAAPRLRAVRLSYAQGFGPRTLDALRLLPNLRVLSLLGCVHVEDHWLLPVVSLPQLEELYLDHIGSRTFFSGVGGPLPPADPGSGITARVVEAIGRGTRLESLGLAYADAAASGLRHLQGLPALRYLSLEGTSVRPADLQWLPPGIEWLTLRNCRNLDVGLGPALAAALPRLRILDLQSCENLGDDCLSGLREIRSLRNLDLSYCQRFTGAAIDGLVAFDALEEVTLRNWQHFGEAEWARVRAMPKLRRLDTNLGSERLR